ncbi:MAG: SPFH domain-containing protein [Acetobacteraceae bacterium]|nr:SPFH domain-containing protein [Acetobacteraceae bacterium]
MRHFSLLCAAVVAASAVLMPNQAQAYYDREDIVEAYFILPNETAFFVPDDAPVRDGQSKFGSVEYLKAKQIEARRFIIPHARFSGSGFFQDYYVPTGRLILVDRGPFNREWTDKVNGRETRSEGFPCQSQEGLNVTVEVAISASIADADAAQYLYSFGVQQPTGRRSDPAVIFTSVFYGRALSEVMEGIGRGKLQSLVCHEIAARTLDKVNFEANQIMDTVQKNASEYFKSHGITIDYLGWAGDFTFDSDIQTAINNRYIAEKIAPEIDVLETRAKLSTMQLWDGHLPKTVSGLWLLPGDVWKNVQGWLKSNLATKTP